MKSSKGITIVSLIIYVIVLSVVIGTVSLTMRYFYKNTDEVVISVNASDQYSRFLAYITDDVNSERVNKENTTVTTNDIKLAIADGSTREYKYEDQKIYYIIPKYSGVQEKYIELCSNVSECTFSLTNGRIKTDIKIGDVLYTNYFNIR